MRAASPKSIRIEPAMHLKQDARFREQRRRYALRFTCEDCALYDVLGRRCVHGYPTLEHRRAQYEDPESALVFCKDFELA